MRSTLRSMSRCTKKCMETVCACVFVQSCLRHPGSRHEANTRAGLLLSFACVLLKFRDGTTSEPSATRHLHRHLRSYNRPLYRPHRWLSRTFCEPKGSPKLYGVLALCLLRSGPVIIIGCTKNISVKLQYCDLNRRKSIKRKRNISIVSHRIIFFRSF